MKSTPEATDSPAKAGPRVAEGIGTGPGSTFGAGISGTWGTKMSNKRGFVLNGVKVVQGGVGMLDPRLTPNVTCPVPVVAGLDGGVTNTSTETSSPPPAQGLGGGVW
jgi:hypothetical protein